MSLSNYSLNQRLNYILTLLQGLTPPPVGGYVTINGSQIIGTGTKTFTILPECSVVPTTNAQLVNKLYVDGLTADDTLQEVLTAGNTATGSHATITLTDTDTGGQANPILTLNNTNATGSVAMEVYKNKPSAVVAGDVLFNQSVYGNDSGLAKQEYTRISHTIRDGTGGTEDGSIEFGCFVNGAFANFLQINGVENEINATKPIDMVGNNIRSSTGSMTLTTALSTGLGNITATAKGSLTLASTTESMTLTTALSTGLGNITATAKGSLTLASATDQVLVNNNLTMATNKTITLTDNAPNVTSTIIGNGALVINDITTSDIATLSPQALSFGTSAPSTTYYTPSGFSNSDNSIVCNSSNGFYLNYGSAVNRTNLDLTTFEMYNSGGNLIDQVAIQNNGAGNPVFNMLSTDNTTGIPTPILRQAGISNQELNLNYSDLLLGTSTTLRLTNTTGGSGTLSYINTADASPLLITSNKSIEINTAIDLVLGGASIQSGTSSGSSGSYLRILLNGVYYKLALDND